MLLHVTEICQGSAIRSTCAWRGLKWGIVAPEGNSYVQTSKAFDDHCWVTVNTIFSNEATSIRFM